MTTANGRTSYSDSSTGGQSCRVVGIKETAEYSRNAPTGINPDAVLASIYCDGAFIGNRWIDPDDHVDLDALARTIAERWEATVPPPVSTIRTAPPQRAITGLPTHLWMTGYRGEPITTTLDALGHPVTVRLTPGPVTWHFGDGTSLQGDFGAPTPSTVTHTYVHRAATTTITATYELQAGYRLDGGPWQPLDPIPVTTTHTMPVHEIQATITDQ